jgi:hypothetical protein
LAEVIYPQAAFPAAETQLSAKTLPEIDIIMNQHALNTSRNFDKRSHPHTKFNQNSSAMATVN